MTLLTSSFLLFHLDYPALHSCQSPSTCSATLPLTSSDEAGGWFYTIYIGLFLSYLALRVSQILPHLLTLPKTKAFYEDSLRVPAKDLLRGGVPFEDVLRTLEERDTGVSLSQMTVEGCARRITRLEVRRRRRRGGGGGGER